MACNHNHRRPSLFRIAVPPSTGIRQLADHFFTTQLHYLETERFLENSAQLRKMVAFAIYVLGKNNEYILNSTPSLTGQDPSSGPSVNDLTSSDGNAQTARAIKGRRGSLDLRRMKLVESEASRSALPKGVPSVIEIEFALSLCQHIIPIVPKGSSAVLETQLDPAMLQMYFDWYNEAVPLIRLQDNRLTMNSSVKATKGLAALRSPKNTNNLLPHTSPPLNFLARCPDPIVPLPGEGWLGNEVSDAIACIYESLYEDLYDSSRDEIKSFPSVNNSLATATFEYFKNVFFSSSAICTEYLKKFVKGIVNYHNDANHGNRVYIFALLSGVIKLDYDIDKIVRHPSAFKFVLKVFHIFLPLKDTSANQDPERGPVTLANLLRTDSRKTMVPCIPKGCITFRSTLRQLLTDIPKSSFNSETNTNLLLSELESGSVRYKGFGIIDIDFMVMKLLTYFCKCYGGFSWFSVDILYVEPTKSRGSSTQGKQKGSTPLSLRSPSKSDRGEEEEESLPTDEQIDTFADSTAGVILLEFMAKVQAKLFRRKAAKEEEEKMLAKLKEEEEVEEEMPVEEEESVSLAETDSYLYQFKEKKLNLPLISYPSENLTFRFANLKDKAGEEVSFEEYRQWSDAKNRENSLSIILRSSLNLAYTVRAAPFDIIEDVINRCKLAVTNPEKFYVLSHDRASLDPRLRCIDYEIQNNSCLRIWEEDEWDEFLVVQQIGMQEEAPRVHHNHHDYPGHEHDGSMVSSASVPSMIKYG